MGGGGGISCICKKYRLESMLYALGKYPECPSILLPQYLVSYYTNGFYGSITRKCAARHNA